MMKNLSYLYQICILMIGMVLAHRWTHCSPYCVHSYGFSLVFVLMLGPGYHTYWTYFKSVHSYNFSPVYVLMCVGRLPYKQNCLPHCTFIWLLSCMCSHMTFMATRHTNLFTIQCAFIRFLSCVCSHIFGKIKKKRFVRIFSHSNEVVYIKLIHME